MAAGLRRLRDGRAMNFVILGPANVVFYTANVEKMQANSGSNPG